ncbi:MAG: hypothetical protein QMD53_04190 [Actinomycetota bacterium]|nr:hypothetical protein [Actinomycetota bacterium]
MNEEEKKTSIPSSEVTDNDGKRVSAIVVPKYLAVLSVIFMTTMLLFGAALVFGGGISGGFERRALPYSERFEMMGRKSFKGKLERGYYCPKYDDRQNVAPNDGDFVCPNCSEQAEIKP